MKIKIKNYQRLEDVDIELKTGLNVVTGGSNNGKSSTIRAIRDFIFNKFSNDKIRHGEKDVLVKIDDTTAERTKSGTKYNVNGKELIKVGRNSLDEVYDEFKIGEIEVNGISIKPNFWFQMDKPFLFDKTPGQKNDLIIGSKNDRYLKALKSIKSKQLYLSKTEKKSLIDSINLLKTQNLEVEKEFNSLSGVDELYQEAIELQEFEDSLVQKCTHLTNVDKLEVKKSEVDSKIKKMEELIATYEKYLVLAKEIEELYEIEYAFNNLNEELEKRKNIKLKLKHMEESVTRYNTFIKTYEDMQLLENDLDVILTSFSCAKDYSKELIGLKSYMGEINEKLNSKEEIKSKIKNCPLCGANIEEEHNEC